jgi:hypothetical protein
MKTNIGKVIAAILITLVLFLVCSCAGGGSGLRTQEVTDPAGISGRYTLILFNDPAYIGLRTVGFLSAEGSGYTITPYVSSDMYTSTPGMSGQEALQAAVSFVQKNPSFTRAVVSGILDPSGRTIGYEVRPMFSPIDYGAEDVMSITYMLKGPGTVEAHVDVIERVQNELSSQGLM